MEQFVFKKKIFNEIDFNNPFFDSLKNDYLEFMDWVMKKSDDFCYIALVGEKLTGFLYLKIEDEELQTIPLLPKRKRLKIGTFKIDAHGTKLGEKFIKFIFNMAINENIHEIYTTVFPKYADLISLLEIWSFKNKAKKLTANGEELVLIKEFFPPTNDILQDYPLVNINNTNKYLLSIYPKYHTILFPDSKLNNEKSNMLFDIPYTNSIHKVYLCAIKGIESIKKGDILLIYRTAEENRNAEYSSVATSVCTVEEYRSILSYQSYDDFHADISRYSVFEDSDLKMFYLNRKYPHIIKMLYNVALPKRITRHDLINEIGLNRNSYFGFIELSDIQFLNILRKGNVNENFIID